MPHDGAFHLERMMTFLLHFRTQAPWAEVKAEMVNEKHLDEKIADRVGEFVCFSGGDELVEKLMQSDLGKNPTANKGLEELKVFLRYCNLYGCGDVVSFDTSLARGLDYYTGVIYEAVLVSSSGDVGAADEEESAQVGSVAGGGRYDKLVGMFDSKNKDVPCVGVSIGIERLFSIMEAKADKAKAVARTTETQVYVASAQKNLLEERMKLCCLLWDAGIKVRL